MKIKKIDKDLEVVIANNTTGGFFYKSPDNTLIIDLDEKGDEDYVTFGQLKTMMSRNRKILKDLTILLVDVTDDEFTLEDVIKALRLNDEYSELKSIAKDGEYDTETIHDFVIESETDRLVKILESKNSKLKHRIFEAAVVAYRSGELSDFNKMQAIARAMGHKDFHNYWMDSEIPKE